MRFNLKHNIKSGKCLNKAVFNTSENDIDFFISSEFGDSSIFKMSEKAEKIIIKTISLDNIIDKIKNKIKLIKIEAEGAEPEILYGLKKHLKRVEYITIDAGPERGFRQESTLVPCVNYLLKNNFLLIDFNIERTSILFRNNINI